MKLYKQSPATQKGGKTYSLGKVKTTSPKMPKGKALKLAKPKTAKMKVKV